MITTTLETYLYFLGTLLIPFSLLVILHNLLGRWFGELIVGARTSKYAYYLSGFIGIPLHELSHAVMAVLFGHRIIRIKWFGFGSGGLYGCVEHSWNTRSLYQRIGLFFIGIAPFMAAIIVLQAFFDIRFQGDVLSTLKSLSMGQWLAAALLCFYCVPSFADLKSIVLGGVVCAALLLAIVMLSNDLLLGFSFKNLSAQMMGYAVIFSLFSALGWLVFAAIALMHNVVSMIK